MAQPLSGLLVLDFTTLLPGPLATLMLAQAGAEVTKIESPDGDPMTFFPPYVNGVSAMYAMLNAGKSVTVVDLKSENGHAQLAPLLARTDILVEQFRPGVMARLGLGYEAMQAKYPRLIYCSISGYGQTGPRASEAGHDLNYIGNTGLLALAPGAGEPTVPPALIADIAGGSFPAVMNILLALRQRDQTGQGCHLDIAMTDAMFTFAWHALATGGATGQHPAPGEGLLTGGSPRYQLYRTKDDALVACAALEPKFWQGFCAAIGLTGPLTNDLADPKATRDTAAKLIASKNAEEWRPIFAAADCCATIVASLSEAMADPHFVSRGLFARASGKSAAIPELPLPIAPQFRRPPSE
ncbi:MAG: CaiB/BaiF CoA transferase family protein [Xanthobacteraceae bacterium]